MRYWKKELKSFTLLEPGNVKTRQSKDIIQFCVHAMYMYIPIHPNIVLKETMLEIFKGLTLEILSLHHTLQSNKHIVQYSDDSILQFLYKYKSTSNLSERYQE